MIEILPPTHCPVCSHELTVVNSQLFCTNKTCSAKTQKTLEHFIKTLKIKGLGARTIEKLELANYYEIYELTKDKLVEKLGSEKIADKLLAEIKNSEKAPLNMLLPAFSVPLIGNTATAKLAEVCDDIYDITHETCRQAGLGAKSTDNLMNWIVNDFPFYEMLPFSFKFEKVESNAVSSESSKGVVCISGKLVSVKTKALATELLTNAGYVVKSSLTKDVTILINESGVESAKTTKARNSGVTIITNLNQFLSEK